MDITITGYEGNIKKFKALVDKQSEKIINMLGDNLKDINIVCKKRGGLNKIELNVYTNQGLFRKEEESDDFESMIAELFKNIENQIKKYNDKRQDIDRQRRRNQKENLLIQEDIEFEDQEQLERDYLLELNEDTRVKEIDAKPMFREEAILEMESTDHVFYLFLDAETDFPSVIYKKNNGGYGILQLI